MAPERVIINRSTPDRITIDPRLSDEAQGLMFLLQSLPPGAEVTEDELADMFPGELLGELGRRVRQTGGR